MTTDVAPAAGLLEEMVSRARAVWEAAPQARLAVDSPARRSWHYLPADRPRAGAVLHELDRDAAKAVLRLLAVGLQPTAYAQAAAIMALEDVLDEREAGRRGRHRGDYWCAVYGEPGSPPWAWHFEGHHLSVNWTIAADGVLRATPLFLGCNPARIEADGQVVLAPLARDEQLAVALVEALDVDQRAQAVLPGDVPADILSRYVTSLDELDTELAPAGVALADLGGRAAELAARLVGAYVGRAPAGMPAEPLAGARFAWAGGTAPGQPRYYRVQSPQLLIELDNTQNGANHIHSVVRRPGGDFGDDVLRAHRAAAHAPR